MKTVSSQDFRNVYEKLYNDIRRYLWPYQVLEVLSDIEVNIYSAFIDVPKLRIDFAKLRKAMKDILDDDNLLSEDVNKMQKLLDHENPGSYLRLPKVNEVNPDNDKRLKIDTDEEEEVLI